MYTRRKMPVKKPPPTSKTKISPPKRPKRLVRSNNQQNHEEKTKTTGLERVDKEVRVSLMRCDESEPRATRSPVNKELRIRLSRFDDNVNKTNVTKRIPVYRKVQSSRECKEADPYELDIPIGEDEAKPKRKRKVYKKKAVANKNNAKANIKLQNNLLQIKSLMELISMRKVRENRNDSTVTVNKTTVPQVSKTAAPIRQTLQTEIVPKSCPVSAPTAEVAPIVEQDQQTNLHNDSNDDMFGFGADADGYRSSDSDISFDIPQQRSSPRASEPIKINVISNVLVSPAAAMTKTPIAKPTIINKSIASITNKTPQLNTSNMLDSSDDGSPWRLRFSIGTNRNVTTARKPVACSTISKPTTTTTVQPVRTVEEPPKRSAVQTNLTSFLTPIQKKNPEKQPKAELYSDFINSYNLSPLKTRNKLLSQENVENYFGFNSSADDNLQYVRSTPLKELNPNRRLPTRLPLFKKKLNLSIANDEQTSETTTNLDFTVPDETETDLAALQLFDDPGVTFTEMMRKSYTAKRNARKRCLSDRTDESELDAEVEKPVKVVRTKKRRRNAKTIAEEKAYEQWAEKFNSMCEDVDKHSLVIE